MWTTGPVLRPSTLLYYEGSAIRSCSAMRTALALRNAMLPHDGILWDPSLWVPSPRPSNTTYRGIWSPCSSAVRIALQLRPAGPYRGTHAERGCAAAAHLTPCWWGLWTWSQVLTASGMPRPSGSLDPRTSQHLVSRDPRDLWIPGPLRSMTSG